MNTSTIAISSIKFPKTFIRSFLSMLKRVINASSILEIVALPGIILLAMIHRFKAKPIDVGIGPEPLISHIYHKQALEKMGYTVETFVFAPYFITKKFDIDTTTFPVKLAIVRIFYLYYIAVSRYKVIYFYFNGGPLKDFRILHRLEAFLFKLSKTKVVVMPYGGDVQDLRLCKNLHYINAVSKDYPIFQKTYINSIKRNMDRWVQNADHIISGCDWVEYMYYWDTLTLTHFPIDTERLVPVNKTTSLENSQDRPIRIMHCPNHVNIKGTAHFEGAIKELQAEGYNIEFIFVQNLPNEEILKLIQTVDILADQLIIGWYAMTALEAMCFEVPVLCYIKPSLRELYEEEGLLQIGELPLVDCNYKTVKQKIKFLIDNPEERLAIGKKSREFVIKHHSLVHIGQILSNINKKLNIHPKKV